MVAWVVQDFFLYLFLNKGYILGEIKIPQACSEAPPLPCAGETGSRLRGLPELNLEDKE